MILPVNTGIRIAEKIDYLVASAAFAGDMLLAIYHDTRALMTQADNLNTQVAANTAAVADLASKFATLSSEVSTQIQQVIDEVERAGANSAAIDAATSRLQATNTELATLSQQAGDMTTRLQADNPATPPQTPTT